MQLTQLFKEFDNLQKKFWDKNLDSIYWTGEINNPDICFVFMNPTWKNPSSNKNWKWLKAPWIWTKNVWKMFFELWFIPEDIYLDIKNKKANDWNYNFSEKIYNIVKNRSLYITNLSKATQIDDRPLKNNVFKEYMSLFEKELNLVNPKIIVSFWNQVSSILLNENIKVSETRKKYNIKNIEDKQYKVFPLFYPVWQGMRNMIKTKEDIKWIINNNL